jgi:hypothetical protein
MGSIVELPELCLMDDIDAAITLAFFINQPAGPYLKVGVAGSVALL